MSTNDFSSVNFFLQNWKHNEKYFEMLSLMASLSKLFSDSDIPFLDYRLAENLFCKYFNAINDARSCTAYDAHIDNFGIGIKTFTLKKDSSLEKIAEFNKLKPLIDPLHGIDLARKLGEFRNERMEFSNNAYGIADSIYHIVGRDIHSLKIFNTPYQPISIDDIKDIKETPQSLHFNDGINEYSFNKSKSVLMKRFILPDCHVSKTISIIDDPLTLLEKIIKESQTAKPARNLVKGYDYVLLPLYSTRDGNVPAKSGLNQWNAKGRERNENEVYIPIPAIINKKYPHFFPSRDVQFELLLPDGNKLNTKICQSEGKALMSNPNSALGEWILRKVMNIRPGVLVTMRDLKIFGFDSVMVFNHHCIDPTTGMSQYSIEFSEDGENFASFIET